jgi:hypothetical protein
MITSAEIARNVAWIKCTHKTMGSEGCVPCIKRYEKIVDDFTDIPPVISVAKYLEPKTSIARITPLTWCTALDIVKIVFTETRR